MTADTEDRMPETALTNDSSLARMIQTSFSTAMRSHLLPALRDDGQDVRMSRSTWWYESDRTYFPAGKKTGAEAPVNTVG